MGHALILWFDIYNGNFSLALREERRLRMFKNRVLRIIFGSKKDDVTGECRKLHNEELYELHCSPNIVRVIGGACSTYGGDERRIQGFKRGNLRERVHLENPGIDGRIILRRIFKKWDVLVWPGSIWLRIGTGGLHL